MKRKPDISGFTQPKDLTSFLEGGAADRAEKPEPVEAPRRGRGRVQKIFNFPEDLADRLRDEAAARSRDTGTRVPEKEIVVAALEAYFSSPQIWSNHSPGSGTQVQLSLLAKLRNAIATR
jgi:hypothetical protein